jgi:hypothetical protein
MPTNNRPKVICTEDHRERLWVTFNNDFTSVCHPLDMFFVAGIGRVTAVMLSIGHTVSGIHGPLTVVSIEEIPGE